jgi:hypothetical protein
MDDTLTTQNPVPRETKDPSVATTAGTASEQIVAEVGAWPGVEVDTGELGEVAFVVGRREIGHVHGDHAAHFSFPRRVWTELRSDGRIETHPVFPDATQGPAARRIASDADVRDVIELFRINYDRATAARS